MLDNVTKRRIDTARDILVGKVPDPKSQVEQITIALIYKFMDDMDAQAEEMGGKRSFFSGEYEKYGWAKLMSLGKGGHEVLNLYGEAITTMNQNEGIPPLFREIFKNAYLPYRDPETLKSFLKIINDFEYDHSERLGDAFEYLLSVLGAQGDAGQFRTPRHIIDFMVEVIDPKKDESILDPACGTAGFLISSWKHILQANSKGGRKGAGLTPDERKRLTENIKGYDISPDMVRLSLVNLYLHGFTDPHISEYDTLTSEDNWNQYSDIIMANPPFMSPKGGIKPHKRFSVQAKRSEVLFVDYIAEHLTPNGRAAVIVPEGIIFQSQNAYKQLRQMLVDNYLYAVVSLPAGIFQPYSGVKTSILLMDKTLAKKCDSILFVKIENDGFDLGAQRREIEKNDLPEAKQALKAFHQACIAGEAEAFNAEQFANVLKVEKVKIGENGEWNLSGERYQEQELKITSYDVVELKKIITTITPPIKIQKKNFRISGKYPIIDQSQEDIAGWTDDEYSLIKPSKPLVIFGDHTCAIKLIGKPFAQGADGIKILSTVETVLPEYLYYYLKATPLETDGYKRHFTKLKLIRIPIPPLKIQQEIVAEIEGYQKIIDGARAVVENYKTQIQIDPEWEIVELGEVCDFKNGLNFQKDSSGRTLKIVGVKDFQTNLYAPLNELADVTINGEISDSYLLQAGDILFVRSNGNQDLVGRSVIIPQIKEEISFSGFTIRGRFIGAKILPLFYAHFFKTEGFSTLMKSVGRGANIRNLSQGILKELKIPLPNLETQTQIVDQIEKEQALVNANKELITLFEQKIKDKIASVWGE